MKIIYCPICGKRISDANVRCPECNFDLKGYYHTNQDQRTKFSLRKISIFLTLVLVCAAISIFAYKSHTSKQSLSSTNPILPEISSTKKNNVIGVYSGDDHEILLIGDDNLAYYYCTYKEYTEYQCPWYVEDNTIYIELSRLHATIYADITSDNKLIFRSDSVSWNTEEFVRLDVPADEYKERIISPYDCNAVQNIDGSMTVTFDSLIYTLPKEFIDMPDEFDVLNDISIFLSIDAQKNYAAALLFSKTEESNINDEIMIDFASSFFSDAVIADNTTGHIAEKDCVIYAFTGYLNSGFANLEGNQCTGYIVAIDNTFSPYTDLIILFETGNGGISSLDEMLDIITTARPL